MRDDRYIEIPGTGTHELPPLLVHATAEPLPDLEGVLIEAEDMLGDQDASESVLAQRKMDLALQLAEQYKGLTSHWFWGDSVLEWIRQCEITFESEGSLRQLLHPDVWPHASRASFVTLLREKGVEPEIVEYLKTPYTAAQLKTLLGQMNLPAKAVVRKKEAAAAGIDPNKLSEAALIDAMVKNPILVERPIVVSGTKAALGRPPENVLKIL